MDFPANWILILVVGGVGLIGLLGLFFCGYGDD
jgi:hypothetical protein